MKKITKSNAIIVDILENWSFLLVSFGSFFISVIIIIAVFVFYSRTRHQGLLIILIAEILKLGWHTVNFLSWVFILPIMDEEISPVVIAQLMNLISMFFGIIWGLLFILGLSRLAQDLTIQPSSHRY